MTKGETAEAVTAAHWQSRRADMIQWLIDTKGFNPKGARLCIDNFIETMCFAARETGEVMISTPAKE